MTIELLREFLDLAESLNFTETANRLYISRTALSKHISSLEKELGIELFVRTTHNVYLTEIGEKFLPNIRSAVLSYDNAISQLNHDISQIKSELKIGFLDAAVRKLLIPCVQHSKEKFPQTTLSLESYELGALDRAVRSGQIDIALTIRFPNSKFENEWCFQELYPDILCAMVPLSSPIAEKHSIRYVELLKERLILPQPDAYPVMAELLQRMAEDSIPSYKPFAEFRHIDAVAIMVEAKTAITVIPKHCEFFPHPNSCFVELEDNDAHISVGALWKSTNSNPLIPAFLNELKQSTP